MIKKFVYILNFFIIFQLCGQSKELKYQFSLTSKLFKNNQFQDALIENDKALFLSQKEFGTNHLTTATLYENKGRLLLKLNNYDKAGVTFKRVIKIRKSLLNKYDPAIAEALDYLAISLRKQNDYAKAEKIHSQVLGIMGKIIANNPGQISELSRLSALYRARAYHNKGDQLIEMGDFLSAIGNYKTAVKIYERTLAINDYELEEITIKLNKYKNTIK